MDSWLMGVVSDAIVLTEHARKKTVTVNAVLHALRMKGKTMYGFIGDGWTRKRA